MDLNGQDAVEQAREDVREIGSIVRWIDQAIECSKRHGNTEGIWLFASQWRAVRDVLSAHTARPAALGEVGTPPQK